MADQLYLSLWFPNFRLEGLPSALVAVMRQFAVISAASCATDAKRVSAAAAYPISFSEAPTYQRLYVNDDRSEDTSGSIIENAVSEATEQLHEDVAYEFEMQWRLWTPDAGPGSPGYASGEDESLDPGARLDTLWQPQPATVKIIGFGPEFDDASFEQNGHIRVDFGLDYPWVLEDEDDTDEEEVVSSRDRRREAEDEIDEEEIEADEPRSNLLAFNSTSRSGESEEADKSLSEAAQYIQRNVEMLLAFTLSVEKHCGISSRLLWTESGEPLAEKLIARLQRLN